MEKKHSDETAAHPFEKGTELTPLMALLYKKKEQLAIESTPELKDERSLVMQDPDSECDILKEIEEELERENNMKSVIRFHPRKEEEENKDEEEQARRGREEEEKEEETWMRKQEQGEKGEKKLSRKDRGYHEGPETYGSEGGEEEEGSEGQKTAEKKKKKKKSKKKKKNKFDEDEFGGRSQTVEVKTKKKRRRDSTNMEDGVKISKRRRRMSIGEMHEDGDSQQSNDDETSSIGRENDSIDKVQARAAIDKLDAGKKLLSQASAAQQTRDENQNLSSSARALEHEVEKLKNATFHIRKVLMKNMVIEDRGAIREEHVDDLVKLYESGKRSIEHDVFIGVLQEDQATVVLVDGRHRLTAIRKTLSKQNRRGNEEVEISTRLFYLNKLEATVQMLIEKKTYEKTVLEKVQDLRQVFDGTHALDTSITTLVRWNAIAKNFGIFTQYQCALASLPTIEYEILEKCIRMSKLDSVKGVRAYLQARGVNTNKARDMLESLSKDASDEDQIKKIKDLCDMKYSIFDFLQSCNWTEMDSKRVVDRIWKGETEYSCIKRLMGLPHVKKKATPTVLLTLSEICLPPPIFTFPKLTKTVATKVQCSLAVFDTECFEDGLSQMLDVSKTSGSNITILVCGDDERALRVVTEEYEMGADEENECITDHGISQISIDCKPHDNNEGSSKALVSALPVTIIHIANGIVVTKKELDEYLAFYNANGHMTGLALRLIAFDRESGRKERAERSSSIYLEANSIECAAIVAQAGVCSISIGEKVKGETVTSLRGLQKAHGEESSKYKKDFKPYAKFYTADGYRRVAVEKRQRKNRKEST